MLTLLLLLFFFTFEDDLMVILRLCTDTNISLLQATKLK